MPFAFGHLVPAWIVGKVSEKLGKTKKLLTRPEWALLLFGAILPDIDYLLQWGLGLNIHRVFTHSLFFAILTAIIVYFGARYIKEFKQDWNFINPRNYALAIFVGICIHIILDMAEFPGVPVFWPYTEWIYLFGSIGGWASIINEGFHGSLEFYKLAYVSVIIDMAIGLVWIGYLFLVKRIKF
ncbi:MAG: metal-dependent hydrolase [archaeon]